MYLCNHIFTELVFLLWCRNSFRKDLLPSDHERTVIPYVYNMHISTCTGKILRNEMFTQRRNICTTLTFLNIILFEDICLVSNIT